MKLGPTGKFPDGKLHAGDDGQLNMGITRIETKDGPYIHFNFGTDLSWFALRPREAKQLADLILSKIRGKE